MGCRLPFPPTLPGSGHLTFENTSTQVRVVDCIKESVFTEETRSAVESIQSSHPDLDLVIVFRHGPSEYDDENRMLLVDCQDASEIPRLAAIDRRARS
jgi:hypothetical protein